MICISISFNSKCSLDIILPTHTSRNTLIKDANNIHQHDYLI